MKQQLKDYLSKFELLNDVEINDSLILFDYRKLDKGEFFVKEHKICTQAAFITKGGLRGFSTNENGEENVICFSFENEFITSFESFFFQHPSKKSLQVMEASELLVIDRRKLDELFAKIPAWQTILKKLTEQEFLDKENHLIHFKNKSAKESYNYLLCHYPQIIRRAKVEYIASYLGITPRTLTRVKRELMTDGF